MKLALIIILMLKKAIISGENQRYASAHKHFSSLSFSNTELSILGIAVLIVFLLILFWLKTGKKGK